MTRTLACLSILLGACAARGAVPSAARALRGVPVGREVRVHLDDGRLLQGPLAAVTADSLRLSGAGACALADVVRVRERRSASARGAGVGAVAGGVLGGVFGGLAGGFLAALDTDDDDVSDVGAVAGGIALGSGLGMAGGGLLGAGAGALGSAWYDVVPRRAPPPAPPRRAPGARLGLHAGLAVTDDFAGRSRDSACLGVAVPSDLTPRLEAAAELAWFNTGMRTETREGRVVRVDDTVLLGLRLRLAATARGPSPFASVGVGWYQRGAGWAAGSLGGGVRWRRDDGGVLDLEVRWHAGYAGGDDDPSGGVTTVAAGWTFDL